MINASNHSRMSAFAQIETLTTRIVATDPSVAEHFYLSVIKLNDIYPIFVVEKDPISRFVDIVNRYVMVKL